MSSGCFRRWVAVPKVHECSTMLPLTLGGDGWSWVVVYGGIVVVGGGVGGGKLREKFRKRERVF